MTFRKWPRRGSREPRSTPEQMREHGFRDSRSEVLWRTGRVILKGQDKTELRRAVYRRANGKCEVIKRGKRCNKFAPWSGWHHGELSHKVASVHGGSDSAGNTEWACWDCHRSIRHPGPQFAAERRRSEDARADRQGPA